MQKRGQATMEFLMTYGWALLAVLIAIGALAFFGILSPAKFLPQACVLGPGLSCEDFKVVKSQEDGNPDNDRIFLTVRNGLGSNLNVFAVYIAKKSAESNEVCGGSTGLITSEPIAAAGFPEFTDGTARQVQSLTGSGIANGINCNIQSGGPISTNCCSTNPALTYYGSICDYYCTDQYSSPLPPRGSKFSEDLIIVYKQQGSNILHQRIGYLRTHIE